MNPENTIKQELDKIPRAEHGSWQNIFRTVYPLYRRAELARDPQAPATISFADAVSHLQKLCPTFQPETTDPEYFGWKLDQQS